MIKLSKYVALTLLITLLAIAALSASVNAQNDATIVMLDAIGGTATPSGTTTYPSGTQVTLTATSTDAGFAFVNWIISSDAGTMTDPENPTTITVAGGDTYAIQPVFEPVTPIGNIPPADYASAAIVVVLASSGGTTNPAAGRYALANATSLELTANANSGYTFSHWVISGSDVNTAHGSIPTNLSPTDNPYKVDHGYGNTYNYQAVFEPISSSPGPSPTIPEMSAVAAIGAVAVMGLVVVGTVAYKRRTK
jgi:general stress protein CsbA